MALFSSILLAGTVISAYAFLRFVALVREHGREGIWIWVEDTNIFVLKSLPFTSSSHARDESERPEEWSLSGSADSDVSDQEAPGGLAVEVKREESSFEPSPNQTLVCEDMKVEAS